MDEYGHIFCFITYSEGYLQKKKNLRTFKEKLQKKVTKNETCDHTYSTRLAWATIHKKELFTKMVIVAKVVVSDCSFLFGCDLWLLQNTDVISTDI